MAKVKENYEKKQKRWFEDIDGTEEEKVEAFEVASSYLYKLLDYAEKDEVISEEELARERRIFSFAKQGPRGAYLRWDKRSKLTSADVIYMLTSTLPAEHIARKFDMTGRKVRAIRRGEAIEWYWEYLFIRRLMTMIRTRYKNSTKPIVNRIGYKLSKLKDDQTYEVLLYSSSIRTARKLREDILTKELFTKLTKNKTLDIYYPVEQIDLL
jgi:hypothetical protein